MLQIMIFFDTKNSEWCAFCSFLLSLISKFIPIISISVCKRVFKKGYLNFKETMWGNILCCRIFIYAHPKYYHFVIISRCYKAITKNSSKCNILTNIILDILQERNQRICFSKSGVQDLLSHLLCKIQKQIHFPVE